MIPNDIPIIHQLFTIMYKCPHLPYMYYLPPRVATVSEPSRGTLCMPRSFIRLHLHSSSTYSSHSITPIVVYAHHTPTNTSSTCIYKVYLLYPHLLPPLPSLSFLHFPIIFPSSFHPLSLSISSSPSPPTHNLIEQNNMEQPMAIQPILRTSRRG